METVISSKGQIIIPAPLRVQDRIVSGQKFEIERVDAGQYLLKRQSESDKARVGRMVAGLSRERFLFSGGTEGDHG